jgi:hypothetical protein
MILLPQFALWFQSVFFKKLTVSLCLKLKQPLFEFLTYSEKASKSLPFLLVMTLQIPWISKPLLRSNYNYEKNYFLSIFQLLVILNDSSQ